MNIIRLFGVIPNLGFTDTNYSDLSGYGQYNGLKFKKVKSFSDKDMAINYGQYIFEQGKEFDDGSIPPVIVFKHRRTFIVSTANLLSNEKYFSK